MPVSASGQRESAKRLGRSHQGWREVYQPLRQMFYIVTWRLICRWIAANASPRTIGFFIRPTTR